VFQGSTNNLTQPDFDFEFVFRKSIKHGLTLREDSDGVFTPAADVVVARAGGGAI